MGANMASPSSSEPLPEEQTTAEGSLSMTALSAALPTAIRPSAKPKATIEDLPTEIMTMILEATEQKRSFIVDNWSVRILSTSDLFALRLSSSRLDYTTLDVFARRFFKYRKHMLSRASIQCLADITASPKIGPYVKEVAFGPERINSNLHNAMRRSAGQQFPGATMEWMRKYEAVWRALVREQKLFDVECVSRLRSIFRDLPNLQLIRLTPYPGEWERWETTWGLAKLVKQVGYKDRSIPPFSKPVSDVFKNDGFSTKHWPGHYQRVVDALCKVQTKSLDLHLEFSCQQHSQDGKPIKVDAKEWQESCSQVQALIFTKAFQMEGNGCFDGPWLWNFVESCRNLRELTLNRELEAHHFLWSVKSTNLRRLTLDDCRVFSTDLLAFFKKQTGTLEEIRMSSIQLECNEMVDPEDMAYPPLLAIFELMLQMPRLTTVRLAGLRQRYYSKKIPMWPKIKKLRYPGMQFLHASAGEVTAKLQFVIDQSYGIKHRRDILLCFSEDPLESRNRCNWPGY